MMRTQIQLTEAQHQSLTRFARRLGISLSEAIRRCVDASLGREDEATTPDGRIRAAIAVCGKYRDAGDETGVAREHDRYLDEAYRS
jgi:hypothetical protein